MNLEANSDLKSNNSENIAYFSAFTAVTFWGVNVVLLKFLTGILPLAALNGVRLAVAAVILLFITAIVRRNTSFLPKLESREWWIIALVGVMGTSAYQFLFSSGIRLSSASFSALVSSTSPIWVALIGMFFKVRLLTA